MSYQQTWVKLIWHLWTTITQIKGGWGRDLREFEDKEAQKPNHLYAHVREKHCLAKISSSGPNPQTSHDYDTCQASHPPPRLLWRQLFPNPWMLRWRLSHSSVWAMITWLGLGRIKRRPAKDSPEVKAEGRQSAAPPTCASKDRTEPNGTPQEAAICWIPF